jgi:hypothetical protein
MKKQPNYFRMRRKTRTRLMRSNAAQALNRYIDGEIEAAVQVWNAGGWLVWACEVPSDWQCGEI